MKKYWIVTMILWISLMQGATGQTVEEWTKQKKTQRKYLLKQIALLQTYLGYLKEGYEIADKGLTTIHAIQKGEFDLHDFFFASLMQVKPAIGNSARVLALVQGYEWMSNQVTVLYQRCEQDDQFSEAELVYFQEVFSALRQGAETALADLFNVVTDQATEMSDCQRLARVDQLYTEMQSRVAFVQVFGSRVLLMAQQRMHDQVEVQVLEGYYGEL